MSFLAVYNVRHSPNGVESIPAKSKMDNICGTLLPSKLKPQLISNAFIFVFTNREESFFLQRLFYSSFHTFAQIITQGANPSP